MQKSLPGAVAFAQHDHTCCAQDALEFADKTAREDGLRLTPVRRRALEVLLENHNAMGAYDVLKRLAEDGFGHQPPVAYRALDFLVDNGLAHRVRRLNAYTACMHPETDHAPLFMICRQCNAVAESVAPHVRNEIVAATNSANFLVERVNVEVLGICPNCQDASI
jgi:Fur family zinc uptake transcriptional regulator